MLPSNLSLINRHRAALPGNHFTATDGTVMSDRDEYRLWDMLWRIFKSRNKPVMRHADYDIWHEFNQVAHPVEARARAKAALRRLASWYRVPSSPHAAFAEVH